MPFVYPLCVRYVQETIWSFIMYNKCNHIKYLAGLTLKIGFFFLLQRPFISFACSFLTAQPAGLWRPFIMMSALCLKSIQYLQEDGRSNINRIIETSNAQLFLSWSVHLFIDLLVAEDVIELRSSEYYNRTDCLFSPASFPGWHEGKLPWTMFRLHTD